MNGKDSDVASLHKKDNGAANGNTFTDVSRETTTDVLRQKIQEIKEEVLKYNGRINDMMCEVLQKIEIPSAKNQAFFNNTNIYHDKRKSSKEGALPDKEFLERNSLLTDLFEISHIRSVYNLFIVTFILLLLSTVASDITELGMIYFGTTTIRICFEKFPTCIYIWSFMQASTFGVYVAFTLWAHQRLRFLPKSSIRKFWDYGWLSTFILYQVLFIVFTVKAILNTNLSIGCIFIVTMEQVRMMMKCHAFVRSTAPRFLSYKPHSETPQPKSPKFSQYVYFLFAPTLVYRDEYPRTKRIRWMVVIRNFLEVGIAIFFLAFILERLIFPVYQVFGTQPLDWMWFVKNIIESSLPCIIFCIIGQYLLLHSWMNAWAEMLQFADRLFYKDYWNSKNFQTYYRTWNVVVHDWLYTYIYKDMYEIVVPRNRVLSATVVFLVSAIFHEYILGFAFGFFFPVLFLSFISIGFPMFFVRKTVTSNVLVWLIWSIGEGVVISLYTIECYARLNCPAHPNYYLDLFIPRSWTCQEQFNS